MRPTIDELAFHLGVTLTAEQRAEIDVMARDLDADTARVIDDVTAFVEGLLEVRGATPLFDQERAALRRLVRS